MNIQTKIVSMVLVLVLLTALSIVAIAFRQKNVLTENVRAELDQLIQSETGKVAQDVYLMCRIMQESLEQRLGHGLIVAETALKRMGNISFGRDTVTWQAINQYTGKPSKVILPKMLIGGRWVGQTTRFEEAVPVVDEVTAMLGTACTLFQRVNETGDMIRVATSVPDSDGKRAIGTYIPRFNPDGSSNPVIEKLLQGETYTGRGYVVNAWYLTGYVPLWDPSRKKVVGALFVGQKQESVTSLRRGIMDIRIGKLGYVAVFGGKGDQQGRYIISQKGSRDNENVLASSMPVDMVDGIGQAIEKALTLEVPRDGGTIPVFFHRYPWQNPAEGDRRFKLAAVTYFEPWDWVIMATAYEDDYLEARERMTGAFSQMINWANLVTMAIIAFALALSFYIARGISRPLQKAIQVFDKIGQGELDVQMNLNARDEIGQLSQAFDVMVGNLKQVTASREELDREIVRRSFVERELRRASARRKELEMIINHSPTVVFLWQATTGWPVEYVSENIRQLGFMAEEFHSKKRLFNSIIHTDDVGWVTAEITRYQEEEKTVDLIQEYRIVNGEGEVCWVETRSWPRFSETGRITHFQSVLLDITVRRKAEEAVHKLAYYDGLTGLPNRMLLLDRLEQALVQAKRDKRQLALLFLDLDGFKEVNDLRGHAFGDLLLKQVGQRLDDSIRKSDTIARFGGDEFVLLLPGVRETGEVKFVAQKILETLNQPFSLEGEQVKVTTSIGIAIYPIDGGDAGTLLKRADIAMYTAKNRGRRGFCFFNEDIDREWDEAGAVRSEE
ncbi:MAG: Cache 3/Cache 2 fusion domain-containing protein [Syntrophotaleaceae bacterium]